MADKLESHITRTYHYAGDKKPTEVKLPRCQALNTADVRAGQQCRNAVSRGHRYCHVHKFTLTVPERFSLAEAEMCFQFDDDEPVVFYSGGPGCRGSFSITLADPFSDFDSNMTFEAGGKRFKLFARKKT